MLLNKPYQSTSQYERPVIASLPLYAGPRKKEDDCIPDKIVMFICLSICINTIILGLHQVFVFKGMTAWLALPVLWSIYNSIPPILFFAHEFDSSDAMENLCFWLQLLSMLSGLGAIVALWFVAPIPYGPR